MRVEDVVGEGWALDEPGSFVQAADRGTRTVHLETGTQDYFAPARRLYQRAGFVESPPFADYVLDPHSVFYRLTLTAPAARVAPATGPRAAQPAS